MNTINDSNNQRHSVGKSVTVVTFFYAINIVVNFLIQILLAANFGAGKDLDAYLTALTVPQLIIIVLVGSLNVTFIPVFIEYETKKSEAEAWRVASIFFNFLFVVLFSAAIIGVIFSENLISLIAPGLNSETHILAVRLSRIMFPSIILLGVSGFLMSIHYAHRKFARPSLAPVASGTMILLSMLALKSQFGVTSIAIGMILGSVFQFVLLSPIIFQKNRYILNFDYKNEGVIKLFKLSMPLILGACFYKANYLIERFFASGLSEGSISYLGFASKIMTVLATLMTQGITISIFPILSKQAAAKNIVELRKTFSTGIRMVLLVVVPVIIGLSYIRIPVIGLLLQRGEFSSQDTVAVANSLLCYSGALFGLTLAGIFTYTFYALQKPITVVKISVFGMLINTIMASILVKYFQFYGIALSYSIMALMNLMIFAIVLRKQLGGLNEKIITNSTVKLLAVSVVMLLVMIVSNQIPFKNEIFSMVFIIAAGITSFMVAANIIKLSELSLILNSIKGYFNRF